MRDSARFHFGFTVPFVPHMGAAGVVAAVSESKGDLGLVPASTSPAAGAWWSALEFDAAPKIIARLPFVERADHPAALPVFVISRVARRRHGDRGRRSGACASPAGAPGAAQALYRRSPNSSPCPTAPSTALRLLVTLPQGCEPRIEIERGAWLRPAPPCARRPSSAATQPAIRLPPTSPDPVRKQRR